MFAVRLRSLRSANSPARARVADLRPTPLSACFSTAVPLRKANPVGFIKYLDDGEDAVSDHPDPHYEGPSTRLPLSVQANYLEPLRRSPTHGLPVCNLQIRSYSVRNLEFMCDIALRAAYYAGLPASGPVPLPKKTERWTVPRANFVYKKSQENYERVTHKRLIQIKDGHPETVELWLAFIRQHQFYGVGMKANVFGWDKIGVGKEMRDVKLETLRDVARPKYAHFGPGKTMDTADKVREILNSPKYQEAAEAPVPEAEAPVPKAEVSVQEAEAPAPEAEASVQEAGAPVQEAEVSVQEAKAPVQEAEASVQEAGAPVQEAEASVQEAEAPAPEAEASVHEAEAPVQEAEAPVQGAEAPAPEAEAPVQEAEASVQEVEAPAPEAEASVHEAEAPVQEAEAPVQGAEAPAPEAEAPVPEAEASVQEAEAPVQEAEAPAQEAEVSKPAESIPAITPQHQLSNEEALARHAVVQEQAGKLVLGISETMKEIEELVEGLMKPIAPPLEQEPIEEVVDEGSAKQDSDQRPTASEEAPPRTKNE